MGISFFGSTPPSSRSILHEQRAQIPMPGSARLPRNRAQSRLDYLVTRNLRDYPHPAVPLLLPAELLKIIPAR